MRKEAAMRHVMIAMTIGAAIAALTSCSAMEAGSVPEAAPREAGAERAGSVEDAGGDPLPDVAPGSLRIMTARMEMEVESFGEAMRSIRDLAAAQGGRVAGSSAERDDEGRTGGSVELRVPADGYEAAVEALCELGEVRDMVETSEDVTEEFVDLEARLGNERRLEARILDLLETRTGTIDDVLEVETQLASVREDIERIEGRKRYLESRISMSTITIDLYERGAGPPGRASASGMFGAMMEHVGVVFAGSVGVLVTAVVALAPWLAAGALLALAVVLALRLSRRRPAPARA
jgi:hypothetical protein